ncbi:MAG: (2Fe-2S)-binding protein [Myxococcales bacterium]|nr:(2Fe-2S)-binding protein [Myxococcales bacterium]
MQWPVRLRTSGEERTVVVDDGNTLLDAALDAGLPVARACGGDGLCGRCGLRVLDGEASLSPEAGDETDAKVRNRVPSEWRLSCRAHVHGPLEVTASYW